MGKKTEILRNGRPIRNSRHQRSDLQLSTERKLEEKKIRGEKQQKQVVLI
jgi:hypothetical protein